MKAASLEAFGRPLTIGTVPAPVLGTGEVVVDVVAAGVLPYTNEIVSNQRRYMLRLPIILGAGAVGRVHAIGPDATRLAIGDWVLCDPTVRSRDDATTPDITLQGLSARGPGGMSLQAYHHDGSYAQQMRLPTENAIALGDIDESEAGRWCAVQTLLVPYGGLLAATFQAGETLLVSGATGNFGSSCVVVALAMGAGRVVAPGRNEQVLDDLVRRFGPRVHPVVLSGDEGEDRKRMAAAAAGPIDVVLDLLPPSAGVKAVRTAIMTVREFGRVVLMGGVGMLGGEDLALPYPWIMRNNITVRGQWMFPRHACARLISLVKSGLLSLEHFTVTEFDLDHANAAIEYAAAHRKPFEISVIRP